MYGTFIYRQCIATYNWYNLDCFEENVVAPMLSVSFVQLFLALVIIFCHQSTYIAEIDSSVPLDNTFY